MKKNGLIGPEDYIKKNDASFLFKNGNYYIFFVINRHGSLTHHDF